MSKKPKKTKIKKNTKVARRGNKHVRASLSFKSQIKGEILSVRRTHGFVQEIADDKSVNTVNTNDVCFVSGRDLLGAVPGDIVLFEIVAKPRDSESKPEARVTQIIEPAKSLLIGGIVDDEDGNLVLVPDSFGSRYPLQISSWGGFKLQNHDKVSFVLKSRGTKHHHHVADITGVYGSSRSARVCVQAYLEEKHITPEFSREAEIEADYHGKVIDKAQIPSRLDLRDCAIFTIDGSDTKDIDDAIGIERTEHGYRLGVHIADVSHYVAEKSALDEEAFSRGTSVYIADLVVPMLPKALSNGICSLNPNEERLAFSCLMEVAKSGELKSFEFKKTVICSKIQGVYSEINDILAGGDEFSDKYGKAGVIGQLPIMLELATTLKKNREGRNAPNLASSESKIVCNEDGAVIDFKKRESGENAVSEGIIEEFMLLANNAAAKLAMEKDLPFVYRVHEPPASEKLIRLQETLTALGITVPGLKPTAESLNNVLKTAETSDKSETVNMSVLRSMMKAKYSEEPLGHFGLVMSEYAHFTSPIRRYPDLSIHRILSEYISQKPTDKIKKRYGKFAHDSALKSTNAEIKAVKAERDCNGFYAAEYMQSRIGEEYDGVVSGIIENNIFVMLENTVEGRVNFAGEDFRTEGNIALSNSVTGVRFVLGDKVRVKCVGANIPLGMVDFEITVKTV
jgi:ribonuclease R